MDESKEAQLDEALIAQFEIEPHLKITTALAMVIHRQLLVLSEQTGLPIEMMNREFILENLAKVKVTDEIREKAALHLSGK